jgi:hypothetical protein
MPCLITCLQNVAISFFFYYAYPITPYVITTASRSRAEANGQSQPRYQGGFCGWRGLVNAFNPMEVVRGIAFAFTMAQEVRRRKKAYGPQGVDSNDAEYVPLKEPYRAQQFEGDGHGGMNYQSGPLLSQGQQPYSGADYGRGGIQY